jgi:hypothetical protein
MTLLPALLAIFGRAAFWPSNTTRSAQRLGWWGRVAGRIVTRPAVTLALGLLGFGALAVASVGYAPAGFGSTPAAPAGSDSAAGNALLAAHFPAADSNPTGVLLRFPASVWSNPQPVSDAQRLLTKASQFESLVGPFDVNQVARATDCLARGARRPRRAPGSAADRPCYPGGAVGRVPRGESVHQPGWTNRPVRGRTRRRGSGVKRICPASTSSGSSNRTGRSCHWPRSRRSG